MAAITTLLTPTLIKQVISEFAINPKGPHGKRGALNAVRYREMRAFKLSDAEFELVYNACWGHTYEDIDEMIDWAYEQSMRWVERYL